MDFQQFKETVKKHPGLIWLPTDFHLEGLTLYSPEEVGPEYIKLCLRLRYPEVPQVIVYSHKAVRKNGPSEIYYDSMSKTLMVPEGLFNIIKNPQYDQFGFEHLQATAKGAVRSSPQHTRRKFLTYAAAAAVSAGEIWRMWSDKPRDPEVEKMKPQERADHEAETKVEKVALSIAFPAQVGFLAWVSLEKSLTLAADKAVAELMPSSEALYALAEKVKSEIFLSEDPERINELQVLDAAFDLKLHEMESATGKPMPEQIRAMAYASAVAQLARIPLRERIPPTDHAQTRVERLGEAVLSKEDGAAARELYRKTKATMREDEQRR